ncbi:hypothetical protein N7453_007672 [Penicillium expansum]|nr:hypothetical protein N7453_007672 [Penicillium expansum]
MASQINYHSEWERGRSAHSISPSCLQVMLESYLAIIASGEIGLYYPGTLYPSLKRRDQFFLKYPDDKCDCILLNDSFDIGKIIIFSVYDIAHELRLAIFREKGCDDLTSYIVEGRKV